MRLDVYLSENNTEISRTKASELIKKGLVSVDGKVVLKPSFELFEESKVLLEKTDEYVSRAAKKLEAALEMFDIDVNGLMAIDLGASTGGFCEVLLNNGAKFVYAVDIGHGQLHVKIASDKRIKSLEGVNARYVDENTIGEKADIVTADLSFISQTLVFEAITRILKPNGIYVGLIKPQFEAGRQNIGKGGIVKDKRVHADVIKKVIEGANLKGLVCFDLAPSPILGGDGNREFLAAYRYKGMVDKLVLSEKIQSVVN